MTLTTLPTPLPTDWPTSREVDCSTGVGVTRAYTLSEYNAYVDAQVAAQAQAVVDAQAVATAAAIQAAKIVAVNAKLAAIGLTPDDLATLGEALKAL
jgi:hypothetical protein